VERAGAHDHPPPVDEQAVAIESDSHAYSFAASQRSASSAAMQPVPAAVTACR
jgi:hypothetical protein